MPSRILPALRSLPAKLIGVLTLALLPLGLISLYQTLEILEDTRAQARASLMARTVAAATSERELIQEALGAAQGLSAAVLISDPAVCSDVMAEFVESHPQFIFAGFIDREGWLGCQSAGQPQDLSDSPVVEQVFADGEPAVEVIAVGRITGRSVVVISHPVFRDGALAGAVNISIPHRVATGFLPRTDGENTMHLVTISKSGSIIAASGNSVDTDRMLPGGMTTQEIFARRGDTFRARTPAGEERVFAVSQMIPGSVALVGSLPTGFAFDKGAIARAWSPLVFPVLMWVVGVFVAYFGLQRLVIRHITALRRAMRQYALGKLKGGRLELSSPPEELRDTERAFNQMVLLLARADARQEQDLRDKEVLLREVHHRVKNNLQLIASIMNMQARKAKTPEARRMLAGLQRRVRGLATLHRALYSTPEYTTVNGADLMEALIDDIISLSSEPELRITRKLDPVQLYPDQAVPLSMILSEALTNAVKYVGVDGSGQARIVISLEVTESDCVRLRVANTVGARLEGRGGPEMEGDGLGSRLMAAFMSQLEGITEAREEAGWYVRDIRFRRRDFETPEQGSA